MKKFTFMLLAAFVAVTSWAQPKQLLPEQFAAKTATTIKQAPAKMEKAPRQAFTGKVQAPVQKANAKSSAAPKKALDFSPLFNGEPLTVFVKSYAFDVENQGTDEEPDYQLVPANIARVSESWTITLDAATMTASIVGISGGETAVTGTVNTEDMTITIPYGQATGTSSYGTVGLASATGAESLVCTLGADAVTFGDLWMTELIDGDYAGYQWSDIYSSEAVMPNGTMAWGENSAEVFIEVDAENFVATVWNFADEGVAVDVTLKAGGKFAIASQLIYEGGSTYGDFYTYNSDCTTPTITGVGTENSLTFDSKWTCYAPTTGYWFGAQDAATITFDGTFAYPELSETPATPATPSVTFFNFWNGEYATVTLKVPCVDVEGNDIISSKLSYQLYTKGEDGSAVVLGQPIAYDDTDNGAGDNKTVQLGEEAKNLLAIGAKSIYTGGGETNESEIAWFEIPQLVSVPEGLEVKEYPVTADAYSGSWSTYTGTALIGIDGTDIYIKGILPHCPDAWAKGTLEDGVATFPVQFMGVYNGSVYIYLAAYGSAPSPVTFTYNADDDMYQSTDYILANSYTDKFGFYYPYFDGMTIGTESIPELVELPEGAEVVEYPFVGTTYSSSGSAEFESTVNVAVVGDDVYVQGLNEYNTETWVKGTKSEDGKIVFPSGQNFGTFDYNGTTYQFFMVGYDNDAQAICDVVMSYNEKYDYYLLETDLIVNGKKSSLSYYTWYEAESTIGIRTVFETTFNFNEWEVPTSNNAATDGDILEDRDFVEGSVTLTVSPKAEGAKTENRFWATGNGPQLRVYSGTLTFSVPSNFTLAGIEFNAAKWNDGNSADCGTFEGTTWTAPESEDPIQTVVVTIAANTQLNSITVITKKVEVKPVEAPEDLETETYLFTAQARTSEYDSEAQEYYLGDPEDYKSQLEVGFYGDKLYIKGFSTDFPDFWVMAKKNSEGKYVIPANQWMGTYEYWGYTFGYYFTAVDEDGNFQDVVLSYDAEAEAFTTDQILALNGSTEDFDPYLTFENVVIEKMQDVAATPADPDITRFVGTGNYPNIDFEIPAVDAEGNDILGSKLFYTIWVEKDGKEQPLALAADLYDYLEEDVTEIPYTFTDDWDIYTGGSRVYLNQGAEEIATWTKVGVQSIYYGGGEVNKSNITWYAIAKVGGAMYATFVPTTDVDFTDNAVEAFAATFDGLYVQLAPVTTVPAGTAVIVKAEAAASYLVDTTTDAVLGASNELVAATADVTADGTQYVLAQVDGTVGFYKTNEGSTIAAGKGYLVISQPMAAFYPFGSGEATGISGIGASTENAVIYNLAGQRVSKMQKGINIVNGKKVLY